MDVERGESERTVLRVLRLDVGEDVMIEEFQDYGDTIGKDEILTDVLELNRGLMDLEERREKGSTW